MVGCLPPRVEALPHRLWVMWKLGSMSAIRSSMTYRTAVPARENQIMAWQYFNYLRVYKDNGSIEVLWIKIMKLDM